MRKYELKNSAPTVKEYKYLCGAVGWTNYMNFEVVKASLTNSLHCITAYDHEQIIGMGRIVGDGAIYFYIQDIVVHPDYQNKGIAKDIMNLLFSYLKQNAPDKAFIGLFASQGKEGFYEKYDFKNYSPSMTGMFTVISKEK